MKQNFESVKKAVDLVDVIRYETGLSIKQVGSDTLNASTCPFCQGHDCFRIKPKEQFWKCFQCEAKGDVFSFIQQIKQLSAPESLTYLADYAGFELENQKSKAIHTISDSIQNIKDQAFEILKLNANDNFRVQVATKEGKKMTLLETLTIDRGHSFELIQSCGVVPSHKGLVSELLNLGFSLPDIQQTGFANKAGKDFFPPHVLLFPVFYQERLSHFEIKDPSGKHHFKARKEHRHPDAIFYNVSFNRNESVAVEKNKKIIIVEGVHDVLSIVGKAGFKKVFATLGQLTQQHIDQCLEWAKQGKTIYLCFDYDDAGQRYTKSLAQQFQKQKLVEFLRVLEFEGEKDIDEWLRKSNTPMIAFQEIVKNARSYATTSNSIIRKSNRYFASKSENNASSSLVPISNFTLDVVAEIVDQDACIRECLLKNCEGESVGPTHFTAKDLSSIQEFGHRLFQCGSFAFWGTAKQLKETLLMEFSAHEGKKIRLLDHIGYDETLDGWIFSNGLIYRQSFYQTQKDGTVWLTPKKGFKLKHIAGEHAKNPLPSLNAELSEQEAESLLTAFLNALYDNIGGYEGWLAYGFVIASAYANEIFEKYGFFPFLFITGKHQSGKNVLANILLTSMGISETEMESLPAMRSSVGMLRKISYFSNLWVWLDEYRATNRHSINDLLRNIYNRVGRTTGIKSSFGTHRYPIRAIVGISGEHQPQDPATRSRCVFVKLSGSRRNDQAFTAIRDMMPQLSGIFFWIIRKKDSEAVRQVLSGIEDIKAHFIAAGLPARESGNLAIPTACLMDHRPDTDFLDWVTKTALEDQFQSDEQGIIPQFLEDIYHLQIKGHLNGEYIKVESSQIYLWLKGIYNVWIEAQLRKGQQAWPFDTLLSLFKEEPNYRSHNFLKRMGHKRTPRRCLVLEASPESDLLNAVQEYAAQWGDI